MSNAGGIHPENLVLGAVLSSLSFFGTAAMSAMVKATEALTSAGVILLFQNLICFLLDEALYQLCAYNEPRGRWLRPVDAPKPEFMDIEVAAWTTMAFDGSVSIIALLQGLWGSRIPGPIAIFEPSPAGSALSGALSRR